MGVCCMTGDEYNYLAECKMCDVSSVIKVLDVDEKPLFCSLCGSEIEVEELD
jgi:hypothetical protein